MTGRTPTIRDVASRAGVSVATASNVVNGNCPVGEASRRRVVEAIAALGYRLDRAASALRGNSTASSAWASSRHHERLFREPRAWRRGARRTRRLRSSDRLHERGCGERAAARRGAHRAPDRRPHRRAGERRLDGVPQGRRGGVPPAACGAARPRRRGARFRHRAGELRSGGLRRGAAPPRPRAPRHRRPHPFQTPRQHRAAHRGRPPRPWRSGPRGARARHLRRA